MAKQKSIPQLEAEKEENEVSDELSIVPRTLGFMR